MRKTWLWGGALSIGVLAAALGYTTRAKSADHIDSPAATASPTADITDVYAFNDSTNVVLVMDIGGVSAPTAFSPATQYVFHTSSTSAYGTAATSSTNIIATFDATGKISLWVGTSEYLTGDASATTGLASADGKVKVFAGPRADPFFFNLDGFHAAVATVEGAILPDGGLPFPQGNDAGCYELGATATTLDNQLKEETDGGIAPNNFAANNVLAIVVSVDPSLLNGGGPLISAWASTNTAP